MLTPMDIEKKVFEKGLRGYDKNDVDAFIALIVTDYEKLYRENAALKDKNSVLTEQVNNYKDMENAMQGTLLAAQKTGEEIKANAMEKANNIINEAELRAKRAVNDANDAIALNEQRMANIKREMNSFKIKAIANLNAQIELLENIDTIVPEEAPDPSGASAKKDFKIDFASRNIDFSLADKAENNE